MDPYNGKNQFGEEPVNNEGDQNQQQALQGIS